jgi:hypothetical protein
VHSLSLVVDCPSNRLDGRLTFQKGFNRAFSLSAFMSSSSRQRPHPIPPLLPQLAESTLKVNQMLVLNHFHVLFFVASSPTNLPRHSSLALP